MKKENLTKLAIAGLLAGSMTFIGCGDTEKPKDTGEVKSGGAAGTPAATYSEVHDCAGLNVCKGLGGCKMTESKLAKLAEKAGTATGKAGSAHGCSGLNECRGLGGCSVNAEKFAKLKAAVGK